MADQYLCRGCRKVVTATKGNRYRVHKPCGGGHGIPEDLLQQGPVDLEAPKDVPAEGQDFARCECGRKVELTRLGYFEPHDKTLRGKDRCPASGTRPRKADGTISPVPTSESAPADSSQKQLSQSSGVTELATSTPASAQPVLTTTSLNPTAREGMICPDCGEMRPPAHMAHPCKGKPEEPVWLPDVTEGEAVRLVEQELGARELATFLQPSQELTTTPKPSPPSTARFLQPGSPFLQPTPYEGPVKPEPMGDLAKELSVKIKETFYAYSNRRTSDNRSAQTTLGPSEIGTPCDRRLAMALLGTLPVNPGGDGWAAFVGTCTHTGMAEVYTFADAGTGRYAVELPVHLGVPTVPRGTTDLLDRRDGTVIDWKVMGAYSLKKFKENGPSATYRTQAHVYGLGAELGGEKVRNVAVVGLPRAGSSLDEMHVWTEKFDRKFAQAALDRVEKIANQIQEIRQVDGLGSTPSEMATAQQFPVDTQESCRFCPFHLKGDTGFTKGCPGK